MDLILHPGHSKCGSTTIQQFLFDNRINLEEKGYAIPDRFFHFSFESESDYSVALPVVDYLSKVIKKGDYSHLKGRVAKAINAGEDANIHTFILSAENLSNLSSKPVHEIFSQCFDAKKVLYYIRRQDDFLLSAWRQWGHKRGKKFAEYCEHQLRGDMPNYSGVAKMLESYYGSDTLEVVPFSRPAFHRGDLISDFLTRAELEPLKQPNFTSSIENKSLNPLVCDYLAKYPEIYETIHDNRPKVDLEKYKSNEGWLFDSNYGYLTVAQRKLILSHFENENLQLHANYFPQVSYDSLFGFSIRSQNNDIKQTLDSLDKYQLDVLDSWVRKWLNSRKRSYIIRSNLMKLGAKLKLLSRSN